MSGQASGSMAKPLIRMELAREEFTGVELQGRVVRVQRQADADLCHKGVRAVEHEAVVKVLRNGVRRGSRTGPRPGAALRWE